jgi:adenylate cyclase
MQVLQRGSIIQKLALGSGLILFVFAATHFLNTALGLVHLETMHQFQDVRLLVTRSWPGTIILAGALALHVLLALYKVARRATWRMPLWEFVQITLGLAIPFFLFPHIVNTRVASSAFGVNDNYLYELARLWPASALIQSMLLVMVWLHGCLGIHFWLRLYEPYRAIQPFLLFVALAIPLAALGGFMVSGRAVAALIENPEMLARVKELTRWPNAADGDALANYRFLVRVVFAAALALAFAFACWRYFARLATPKLVIKFQGGPTVRVAPGATLLEISRMHKVPHAAICGGRSRCSTCRVRVDEGADGLAPPIFSEAFTLSSIGAPENVRLACQIRPTKSITVTRLLRPETAGPKDADLLETDSAGVEKPLVAMFLDLRDFTQMSQGRLPYDVVYILNEFFAATGGAITEEGGWIDKFLGDGLLAIFGQHEGVEAGCRQALRAARAIDLALDHVNAKLEAEIGRPLRVGIGLHAGPLLIGRIGYGESIDLTVVGNTVNVASRLESLTKEKGFQIVLSRTVADYAGWSTGDIPRAMVSVRGVAQPVEVLGVVRGRDLPVAILTPGGSEKKSRQTVA